MSHDVDESWDRIEAWLRTNAPTTYEHVGVPARKADIPPVAALVGELPEDLIAWWRRSCGTTKPMAARLLVGYAPYSIEEALDCRSVMLGIADMLDIAGGKEQSAKPAGSPTRLSWSPMWVPIAGDSGGDDLFVDLRPGPERGCVMEWRETEGAAKPLWSSVADMLAEIADALDRGKDIDGVRPEVRDDGTIDWD
ncbi:cell wall assembly regulator SMI1 [Saccharothrix ecbatanensis]|uniref:Cell wall assembly regulator SMI1 n=1 Tax=Saccharothrix ecbatanensis TaxID=1105145 RepID=A0A7W9M185_9PSEU|nr:SMI1/KNR4 family protein [Saccharothrix ecbatanensis]MBB5803714.1 cell wall assembly regulator SMI1 [Saccharothrix ecbatanensis]